MLNLRGMQRVCVLGGGTAGWFAALHLRQLFSPTVEIMVISAPEIPVVGVGEGGVLNFISTLEKLNIPLLEFMQQTEAVHKLGFVYEGWRENNRQPKDYFYHMFPVRSKNDIFWEENGYYPIFSVLSNNDIPISHFVDSIGLREKNIEQSQLTQMFVDQQKRNFASSFHFDTYKVGQYLRSIALKRGVIHKEAMLKDILQDTEVGNISAFYIDGQCIPVNFVVDASGFSRQILGKKLGATWQSFKDYLPLNSAIPFHLKHKMPHPDLVTRATAMNSGWVWQIPLQHRIGAGYVFDRNFISPEQAVDELEQWLGHEIEPIRLIEFEAGFYEKVWQGNVMAIGLASGFVEPLEATSIGQMLQQLDFFVKVVKECHGIVSQQTIDFFNRQNMQGWYGIRDFIRMHYDTGRMDTPFWDMVQTSKVSTDYQLFKEIWQYRTPRNIDFVNYEMGNFLQFGLYSWFAIGQALGIIKAEATVAELVALSADKKQKLAKYLFEIKNKIS